MRLVSVEPGLEDVKKYLSSQGYDVQEMDTCVRSVEAVVYQGTALPAGAQSSYARADGTALVNAAGMTPEEVAAQIENKLY